MRAVSVCAAAALLFAAPAQGAVSTPQIAAKKAEAAAAQSKLADMQDQFEMRVEEYDRINEALDKTRAQVAFARTRLAQADADLAASRDQLEQRAAGIYRGGEVDVLEVLVGTTSFEDFLTRVDLLRRISASDAELVAVVKSAREEVVQTKRVLDDRETELIALRRQAADKKAEIQDAVARQRAFVGSLNAAVAKLVKTEEDRQRKLAEERARLAAAAAKGRVSGGGRGDEPYTGPISPAGAGHPECVTIAMRYLGVPYVWGGESPAGFDCSGLVKYVYAKIGIQLPRVSSDQYHVGQHIPSDRLDLLKPGDLVFFGYGGDPNQVHHVGIYAGDGNFINAPASGGVVRISSLTQRIADRHDYVGASRL